MCSDNTKIARLHNICLPRILADEGFKERHLQGKRETQSISAVNSVAMEVIGEVTLGSEGIENAAEIIEEDEFRVRYLPEVKCAEMAINFIAAEKGSRSIVQDDLREFGTVESMIKSVFPHLLNSSEHKVGQAKNCVHEIHLKPGSAPVKHRVRRVPVHLREELKKNIESMLSRGIIRPSKSEWAASLVLVRKKDGTL